MGEAHAYLSPLVLEEEGVGGDGDDNSFDRRTISDSTAKTILYVGNPR